MKRMAPGAAWIARAVRQRALLYESIVEAKIALTMLAIAIPIVIW